MDGSRRLAWFEDYAVAAATADAPVPDRLAHGIRLDHVSFAYPGTARNMLDDVSLTLPAGAVVAVVGENGAGKTTLVKLLAKLYEPSSSAILVDDAPLARMPAGTWRSRLAVSPRCFPRWTWRRRRWRVGGHVGSGTVSVSVTVTVPGWVTVTASSSGP